MFVGLPAYAQGIGLSGTFYRQHFTLRPGETSNSADVYLVVFNQTQNEQGFHLTWVVPNGVDLILSANDFTLSSGASRQVQVGVAVGATTVPGDYDLQIAVEARPQGEGIHLTGAIQQQAKLTVLAGKGTGSPASLSSSQASPASSVASAAATPLPATAGKASTLPIVLGALGVVLVLTGGYVFLKRRRRL